MRVLTVRQPWAWAIIHGGKDVENRVRNSAGDYRGPIAIHAGRAQFEDDGQYWEVRRAIRSEELGWPASDGEVWAAGAIDSTDARFAYGAIIGVVDLASVHRHGMFGCPGPTAACSPWADLKIDTRHLVLSNPRALDEPLPWKGALGLRRSTLDVYGDYLIDAVDGCTCGQSGIAGPHEPMCGFEMVARLVATS